MLGSFPNARAEQQSNSMYQSILRPMNHYTNLDDPFFATAQRKERTGWRSGRMGNQVINPASGRISTRTKSINGASCRSHPQRAVPL